MGDSNKSCPVPVASLVQLFGPRSWNFKQVGVFCCILISHSYLDSLRNRIPRDGFLCPYCWIWDSKQCMIWSGLLSNSCFLNLIVGAWIFSWRSRSGQKLDPNCEQLTWDEKYAIEDMDLRIHMKFNSCEVNEIIPTAWAHGSK